MSSNPNEPTKDDYIALLHSFNEMTRLFHASEADNKTLAQVGRMYLAALDSDPENEMLTLPQALMVTAVREAVERAGF